MNEKRSKYSLERIYGICTYPIYGGAVVIFQDLLLSLGIRKCFLNETLKNTANKVLGVDYIPTLLISKSPQTWFKFLIKYFRTSFLIYKNTKECGMVIANDFVSLLYIFPHKLFKKLDVYYFCHGAFRLTGFNKRILSRFINYCSDIIIVPSLYLKNDLIEMGVKAQYIHCIYNGTDDPKLPMTVHNENLDKVLKVGIVGIIQDLKGQDIFIEAIKNLNSNGYSVIGSIVGPVGEEEYHQALKKKSADAVKAQTIIFKGALDHQTTIEFMNTQDVIICLSKYRESLGMVLLEAMSLRKPIIGTRVGGIPEVITDNANGYLIDPNDSQQLEEAIIKLMKIDVRTKLGEMGYKIYLNKFNRETFLEQHRLLIEDRIQNVEKSTNTN